MPRSHPHMPPGRLLPFRSPTEAAHTAGPGGHHPPGQPKAHAGLALLPATGLPLGRPEARAHLWAPLATASHCQARGHLCPRRGAAWPHHVHGPAPAPPTHRPSSAARVGLGTSKLPGRGGCRPCRAEVMVMGPYTDYPWDSARLPLKAPTAWGPSQRLLGCVLAGSQGPARTPQQTARARDRVWLKCVSSHGGQPAGHSDSGELVHERRAGPPQPQGSPPRSASAPRSGNGCGDPDSVSGGDASGSGPSRPNGAEGRPTTSPGGLSPGLRPSLGQPALPVRRAPPWGRGLWSLSGGLFPVLSVPLPVDFLPGLPLPAPETTVAADEVAAGSPATLNQPDVDKTDGGHWTDSPGRAGCPHTPPGRWLTPEPPDPSPSRCKQPSLSGQTLQ